MTVFLRRTRFYGQRNFYNIFIGLTGPIHFSESVRSDGSFIYESLRKTNHQLVITEICFMSKCYFRSKINVYSYENSCISNHK